MKHLIRIIKQGKWYIQAFDKSVAFGIFIQEYDGDWIAINLWIINVQVNY